MANCSWMLVEPSELVEVIWLTPAIWPSRRSSGAATVPAITVGSAPGRDEADAARQLDPGKGRREGTGPGVGVMDVLEDEHDGMPLAEPDEDAEDALEEALGLPVFVPTGLAAERAQLHPQITEVELSKKEQGFAVGRGRVHARTRRRAFHS